jgi:GNAT superfamily N-acetyltransferase
MAKKVRDSPGGADRTGMTTIPPLALSPSLRAAGVSLRPVGGADLPFLRRLYRLVRWDEFAAAAWPDAMKAAFLDGQFELQRRAHAADHPGGEFYLVSHGETPIGRLYVDRSGPDLELLEISLLPEWRGKGLGGGFLALLQDTARADRRQRIRLSVRPANPARRLYRRMGFVEAEPAARLEAAYLDMVWPAPTSS